MLNKEKLSRFYALLAIYLAAFLLLLGRMAYLQLWRGDYYDKQAEGNRLRQSRIIAPRGLVLDAKGRELVNNLPSYSISLQKQNEYDQAVLQELSALLQLPLEEIQGRIKESANYYQPIRLKSGLNPKREEDMELITKIEERRRNLSGVLLEVQPIRQYCFNDLAAHTLGYVGEVSQYEIEHGLFEDVALGSIVGKAGLEKSYDEVLRGRDGAFMEEVDASGRVVQHIDSLKPQPGKTIRLTIDYELQKVLEEGIDRHLAYLRSSGLAPKAGAASVVVLDPRSGAVRALVSRPGFDPNWFVGGISSRRWNRINNDPYFPLNNKAISGEYPPGSTFKIVTGSAAFELHKVGLNEPIYDGGFHPDVPSMGNAGGEVLGWLTFIDGLAMSDNVYFYELGKRVGIDNLARYAAIYGFGRKTGIDLEGESQGLVASKEVKRRLWNEDWRLGDTFNAAIGQGFNLATPLQLAVMLGCVANGGTRYPPYLVDKIIDSEGRESSPQRPQGEKINVSSQTIAYMQQGMEATTREGGTAAYFSSLAKKVAGKTGTSENSMGRDHGLFVAYGPVDDPQIVVVCVVEQGGFGATAAGPIVYQVFEEYFRQQGWQPRYRPVQPAQQPAAAPEAQPGQGGAQPNQGAQAGPAQPGQGGAQAGPAQPNGQASQAQPNSQPPGGPAGRQPSQPAPAQQPGGVSAGATAARPAQQPGGQGKP